MTKDSEPQTDVLNGVVLGAELVDDGLLDGDDVAETVAIVRKNTMFVKGGKGGPGRPKGTGQKQLADKFLKDLNKAWDKRGPAAIDRAISADPMGMVRVVAQLVPKQVDVSHSIENISEAQLDELINMAKERLRLRDRDGPTTLALESPDD